MIQQLLGAAGFIGGDTRKISFTGSSSSTSFGSIFEGGIITSSTTNSPLPTKTTVTTTSTSNSENQNQSLQLRCPRCDSPNTKFCYYNNYNLTQPRHFCKTCRRYWTKGGALRNVPIGGGCRKNKNSSSSSTMSVASFVKSAPASSAVANKMKALAYHEQIERAGLVVSGLFDRHQELISSNPLMWNNSSQLLPILRTSSSQNPNVNTVKFDTTAGAGGGNTTCARVKEEQQGVNIGTHHHQVIKGEPVVGDTSRLLVNSEGNMVLNPLVNQQQQQIPSNYHHQLGLLWKSNQSSQQLHNRFQMGLPVQNLNSSAGIYQRPKISTNNSYPHDYHYYSKTLPADHLSNDSKIGASAASSATNSSTVTNFLESAPVAAGGDLACWNPVLAWNDLDSNN